MGSFKKINNKFGCAESPLLGRVVSSCGAWTAFLVGSLVVEREL